MLENVGFRSGPVRMIRHSKWLRTSADLSASRRGTPRWHRLLRAKVPSRLATWYNYLSSECDAMLVAAER